MLTVQSKHAILKIHSKYTFQVAIRSSHFKLKLSHMTTQSLRLLLAVSPYNYNYWQAALAVQCQCSMVPSHSGSLQFTVERKTGFRYVNYIRLTQGRYAFEVPVTVVMNSSHSKKGREFLDRLNDYQLLRT
jgi:hypothetical protein